MRRTVQAPFASSSDALLAQSVLLLVQDKTVGGEGAVRSRRFLLAARSRVVGGICFGTWSYWRFLTVRLCEKLTVGGRTVHCRRRSSDLVLVFGQNLLTATLNGYLGASVSCELEKKGHSGDHTFEVSLNLLGLLKSSLHTLSSHRSIGLQCFLHLLYLPHQHVIFD